MPESAFGVLMASKCAELHSEGGQEVLVEGVGGGEVEEREDLGDGDGQPGVPSPEGTGKMVAMLASGGVGGEFPPVEEETSEGVLEVLEVEEKLFLSFLDVVRPVEDGRFWRGGGLKNKNINIMRMKAGSGNPRE